MKINYKVGDIVIFITSVDSITEGTEGIIKRFIGCSCKPDVQGAVIEVGGEEYVIVKFRNKVELKP